MCRTATVVTGPYSSRALPPAEADDAIPVRATPYPTRCSGRIPFRACDTHRAMPAGVCVARRDGGYERTVRALMTVQ
jgi:hypothetical protein